MKFLLLLASLVAGVAVAWLTILGAVWYVAPIFLVLAGIVAISLDNASRLRIVAFSVGMLAVFAIEAREVITDFSQHQDKAHAQLERERRENSR